MIIILITSLFFIKLAMTIYIFKSTSRIVIDPVQKIYEDFCKKLSRKGLQRHSHEGPVDFSYRAKKAFPDEKDNIEFIIRIYINHRYKSKQHNQHLKRMKQMVKTLKLN